jgi:cysteinyl-tRNA synthetase
VDLIFPHHENEIAQSEAATGKQFVRYWVHSEFLLVEGEKMAKSKGNFYTLRDLLAAGHRPEAIRYLLLSVNYRRQLNFTQDGLHQAEASVRRLEDFVQVMRDKSPSGAQSVEFLQTVENVRRQFIETMNDDLNTSAALAVLFDFVRVVYQQEEQKQLSGAEAQLAASLIEDLDRVLGILSPRTQSLDADIQRRIDERQAARKRRDFAEADRIRKELLAEGIQLEDTKEGVRWKKLR